jgi:hypothetical protein
MPKVSLKGSLKGREGRRQGDDAKRADGIASSSMAAYMPMGKKKVLNTRKTP